MWMWKWKRKRYLLIQDLAKVYNFYCCRVSHIRYLTLSWVIMLSVFKWSFVYAEFFSPQDAGRPLIKGWIFHPLNKA